MAPKAGTLCFISGTDGKRACATPRTCAEVMSAERQRVFRRISELAAQGDEAGEFLAGEFTSPDQLLGGEDAGGLP